MAKIKKMKAGVLRDPKFAFPAKFSKNPNESFVVMGLFPVNDKKYVSVAYYDSWFYRKWFIKNGFISVSSLIYPPIYYKADSLSAKTKAILILNENAEPIENEKVQISVARTALVWADTYLLPVFRPGTFRLAESVFKMQEKIYKECYNRKLPDSKEQTEQMFYTLLRLADKQVIEHHSIFKKHLALLKNAEQLFKEISDKPTETKVLQFRVIIQKLANSSQDLSEWCEKRAKTWLPFVESAEFYKSHRDNKKGLVSKYGPKGIWVTLLAAMGFIATGDNLGYSIVFSLITEFGVEGFKQILSFKWQASSLKKQAKAYLTFSRKMIKFLTIYEMALEKNFLR
jgi:hypothetical protein